jgi:hypothetical protein
MTDPSGECKVRMGVLDVLLIKVGEFKTPQKGLRGKSQAKSVF